MKIAIYGKTIPENYVKSIQHLIDFLENKKYKIHIYKPFELLLQKKIKFKSDYTIFTGFSDINREIDFLISIGGDGTLLNSITLIKDTGIPILGVNTGRLGFLSSISIEEIDMALDLVFKKKYRLEKRSLIELISDNQPFGDLNYALNELTIVKKETTSLITINTYVNEEFLNSYWADGIIIATPTGSTAYSLSCGGPIISPESENFLITPISSHNLTVRPFVIPDKHQIKLKVTEDRNKKFLISLDSRTYTMDCAAEIIVKKASFKINLIRLENENFFSTLRNKLMWGLDKRN